MDIYTKKVTIEKGYKLNNGIQINYLGPWNFYGEIYKSFKILWVIVNYNIVKVKKIVHVHLKIGSPS